VKADYDVCAIADVMVNRDGGFDAPANFDFDVLANGYFMRFAE